MPNPDKLKEKLRRVPHLPGVYVMKDRFGDTLYVGKAKDLKKRVSTYFQPSRKLRIAQPKVAAMLDLIHDFEVIEVRNETEALLLEGRLIKERRPRYNTDFTDDKRFLLVRLDWSEELPRFRLTRNRRDDRAVYFGPFAHSGMLRNTLQQMRRDFGILLGDASPTRVADGRWRLYNDVRAEIYNSEEEVTTEEYRGRVEKAAEFLQGKASENLKRLREEMKTAAEERRYERAAELRDVIEAIEKTTKTFRKFTRQLKLPMQAGGNELEEACALLRLPGPPRHIECFDISHISGTFCVASMAHFTDGRPDRAQARRFKIKTFIGNDDFRAMREVVSRRYKRLFEEHRPFPDLIVIDGGRGQVTVALEAFRSLELEPPPLIGLAKREEAIIFADGGEEDLVLPRNHPVLHLLQRVRDEAHRIANTYNADLRSRRIRESILDDFPGLGPVRKARLLTHFQDIARLRKASADDIHEVPGIGPRMAKELHEWLQQHQRTAKEEERAEELFGPPTGKDGEPA